MTVSLKHRLQLRFVLLSLAALLILQSLIVGFSLWRNYRQITLKADRMIMTIISDPDSSEVADARYFTATYDLSSRTLSSDTSHTALISRSQAADFAKSVIADKTDKGYKDNYRYLVHRGKNGISIVFLSRTVALESFRNSAVSLLIISGVGIALMTAVLAAVSGKVVSPLVKNRQKQKEFITSASHELKTPLTAISGYAELIENGMISSDDEIRRMAGEIHNNSGRLITLINDVIRLSELDEEQEEILEKVPLSVVAQSSVKMLQMNAEKHHVTLPFEGEDAFIWGTRQMVDEVLYNLCDNAIRYNKENGSVTVKVHRQNDCAVLIVQDTYE